MLSIERRNLLERWTGSDRDDGWCSNSTLLMLACLRHMSTVLGDVCTLSQLVPSVIDLMTLIVLRHLLQEPGEHNLLRDSVH